MPSTFTVGAIVLVYFLGIGSAVSFSEAPVVPGQAKQGEMKLTNGANLNQLRDYILRDMSLEAETFVRRYPAQSESVLRDFEVSENTDARRIAVELAGINPSLENCRLLMRRLSDTDMEVKELAISQISVCNHPELMPGLLEALTQSTEPDVQSALVLLIGKLGADSEIKPLTEFRKAHKEDPALDHDLSIALARLGDPVARAGLVKRLRSNVDSDDRVSALNDCIYVGDISLVMDFAPALDDYRDVVALSIPENPPMEYARVADIAVYVMVQLGVKLSFPLEELIRLSFDQLEEANRYVQNMK